MGKDWYEGCTLDREWRLNHLYYILDKDGNTVRFRLNWAQRELLRGLHYRNNVLKARQLGMSTFTSILMLDSCLHCNNYHCGIIDKSLPDAEEKMSKIKFAYMNMLEPPELAIDPIANPLERKQIALHGQAMARAAKGEISTQKADFANGSQIRIGTSMRGGTLQILHVSELGHIAATAEGKAEEILSGGINTVSQKNLVIMESTHEGGKYGLNYALTKMAMDNVGKKLSPLDFKFFFFPWWKQEEYALDGVKPSSELNDYFSDLENQGIALSDAQKAWYIAQFRVFGYLVKREYPSTPDEAFQQQVEGAIYGKWITRLRAEGKLAAEMEADESAPLYVSWDIGMSDYMSLWLIQPGPDGKFYILDYYSANDQKTQHYINRVRDWEAQFGTRVYKHLLPHDAARRDWEKTSFQDKLMRSRFFTEIVPRTNDVWAGIQQVREMLPHCVFHKRCSQPVKVNGIEYISGVDALENYQSEQPGKNGIERPSPRHNECSHGADAFRTFAEALANGMVEKGFGGTLHKKRRQKKGTPIGVPSYW